MDEGPEPRPVSAAVRSGVSFVLTLIVVIVVGALGGYALGRYVFDRLMTASGPATRPAALPYDAASSSSAVASGSSTSASSPTPARQGREGASAGTSSSMVASPAQPGTTASRSERSAPQAAAPAPQPGVASGPAFFVQVGAFGSLERANAMAQRLRQEGFPVLVETQQGNPVLYKVRVGPYSRRDDAIQALQRIKPAVPDAFIP